MSAIYDNWERLVAAVLKREELWQLFHDHSRSPSVLSEASDFSSSYSLRSPVDDLAFEFSSLGLQNPKVVLISDFSPAFGVHDLRLASSELLGRGTFGSTYTAAMNNGETIVVKRLEPVSIAELEFKRHMVIVGNVRHENVVALRAYYYSQNERLMLYDYYSKGSVYALLHGQAGENRALVDWHSRLKIAIGAARGIAEIHKQAGRKLVHGNIKSSNIFLNSQQYGCVSDLGLANMIETAFKPAALCYAPELKSTQNVSQASDVYGFGILLLELLTRKSVEYLPGGPQPVDLVKLVDSVKSKERAVKVFDADLLKHPAIEEGMVKMLRVGVKCVSKSIKKRPKMSGVVKMLDNIGNVNLKSHVPFERKLVSFEDAFPACDLEDLLFVEALVGGAFGAYYRARLENGNAILVKRLWNVRITFEEFQQHMMVIGGMRHKNIIQLRAYYFSSNEKLFVYDNYSQGNVYAALHDTNRRPLDWETRLKIALDAARGIAHIHRQDGWTLVHGDIISSHIFINGDKCSAISDVGLAKLIGTRLSFMPSPGYCAPEVTDAGKVSQASDVYSFGVVLLELITGKPSQHTTNDGKVISLVDWVQSFSRYEWTAKVFDLEILRYPNEEEAIVQLLQLAMNCVSIDPERRPRMPEIVKMLEEMSGLDSSHESSLEDVLEDLLEDLLPSLTPP